MQLGVAQQGQQLSETNSKSASGSGGQQVKNAVDGPQVGGVGQQMQSQPVTTEYKTAGAVGESAGEDNKSVTDPSSIADTTWRKVEDSVKERLTTAPNNLDTVYYGLLSLTHEARMKKVWAYSAAFKDHDRNKGPLDSFQVTVKDVELNIEEWHILKCFIRTDTGIFENRCPISLLYYNQGRFGNSHARRADQLYFTNLRNQKYYIQIGSVLNFDPSPRHRVSMEQYDITLLRDTGRFAKALKAVPVADNIINFSIFTDVVGLFGEPNGLVQFEADAYIPISQGNVKNHSFFLVKGIRPYFSLIRMDKEYQVTDLRGLTERSLADSTVTRLYRQAFLIGGLDLNVLSGYLGTNTFNYYMGGEFRQSRVLVGEETKRSANMITPYMGINFTTRAFENFRIGADVRWAFNKLVNADLYDGDFNAFLISNLNICYFPPFRPQSKVFLRLTYNYIPALRLTDYMQVQVGYKTPLSSRMKSIQ